MGSGVRTVECVLWHCWPGGKMVWHFGTNLEVPEKVKHLAIARHHLAIPLRGTHVRKMKTCAHKTV